MIGKDWAVIQNEIQKLSAGISFLLNTYLILLICTKSPAQLGAYKYLMIIISVYEIAYSVIDVVVSPILHSYGPVLLVLAPADHPWFTRHAMLVLDSVYTGFFGFAMAIFALHFVYRYLVAIGSPLLESFNTWKFALWLSFPCFFGVTWAIDAYYLCGPNPEATEHIRFNVLEALDLDIDRYVYIGTYFLGKNESGEFVVYFLPLFGMIIMSLYITSSLIMVLVFSVKCYYRITSLVKISLVNVSMISRSSQNLQSQLFYALVTQTMIPAVLMYIPVGIMYLFAFLNIDLGSLSGIAAITIAMYPAIDPLPTMFMITSYRNAILEKPRRILKLWKSL